MAFRYFPSKSQAWLESALSDVLQERRDGRAISSTGSGDVNAAFQNQRSIDARQNEILHDLNVLDAVTYPRADISRPTSTTARFRD